MKQEEEDPKKEGEDVTVYSSNIYALSRRDLDTYGERIMLQVLSAAKDIVHGSIDAHNSNVRFELKKGAISDIAEIKFPTRSILNFGDTTNYSKAKAAAREIINIHHEMEVPILKADGTNQTNPDGSPKMMYKVFNMVQSVTVDEEKGMIAVTLSDDTWGRILDISKGYTSFSLLSARQLRDPVAIRLYQILANSRSTLEFGIDELREMFKKSTYQDRNSLFIKKVIDPAVAEINRVTELNLSVEQVMAERNGQKGRKSVSKLIFVKEEKIRGDHDLDSVLTGEEVKYLTGVLGFSHEGVLDNLSHFRRFKDTGLDLLKFLRDKEKRLLMANEKVAYTLKSMQNEVQSFEEKRRFSEGVVPKAVIPVVGRRSISKKASTLDVPQTIDNKGFKKI